MTATQDQPRMMGTLQPARTTLMIKPVGGLCNLDCHYCYYLPTIDDVYGGREHKMKLDTLESVFAGYLPHADRNVVIAWQGGEPTLAGLAFFEKAVEYQHKYKRPGQTVSNSLQTNGTLLDEAWCRFFAQHKFLIGISIDGLSGDHNLYRVDKGGRPSFDRVMVGLKLLRKHQVEHNILCVLNNENVKKPIAIFNAMMQLGERWMQFIPAIEWVEDGTQESGGRGQGAGEGEIAGYSKGAPHDPQRRVEGAEPRLAPFSPDPEDYGRFLCQVFDLWFDRYRDKVSVRHFDTILGRMVTGTTPLCILAEGCHSQLTVEHNGDLFGCDHFVEQRWQLGHIGADESAVTLTVEGRAPVGEADLNGDEGEASEVDTNWLAESDDDRLATFAARKQNLPDDCRSCQWLDMCWGGCPKHRAHRGDEPEPTILCAGYKMFMDHAHLRLEWLAQYLRQGMQPPPPSVGQASRGKPAKDRPTQTRPGNRKRRRKR